MKNLSENYQVPEKSTWVRLCLHLLAALLLILTPILLARAQKSDRNLTVSGVSSYPTADGTIVTIAADNSLNHAQTYQDRDGFHVIVPDAGLSELVQSSGGVRVRRVGS